MFSLRVSLARVVGRPCVRRFDLLLFDVSRFVFELLFTSFPYWTYCMNEACAQRLRSAWIVSKIVWVLVFFAALGIVLGSRLTLIHNHPKLVRTRLLKRIREKVRLSHPLVHFTFTDISLLRCFVSAGCSCTRSYVYQKFNASCAQGYLRRYGRCLPFEPADLSRLRRAPAR